MTDDRGQTSIEWLGVALVVAALLTAVATTDVAAALPRAFTSLVCTATGGGCAQPVGEEGTRAAAPGTLDDADAIGDGVLSPDEAAALAAILENGDPAAVHDALAALDEGELAQAVDALGDLLALTDGVPQDIRVRANAVRIAAEIDRMRAELALLDPDDDGGVLGAIDDLLDDINPVPDVLLGPPAADTPAEQAAILRSRIDVLEGWLTDDRQIIAFVPPSTPYGDDATIVEVFGDLATADNVGVIVPGITNGMDSYDAGLASHARAMAEASEGRTAVVAHLGYDTPDSLTDAATRTGARAREAAPTVAGFVDALDADGRDRNVTLVGHSYGSRVAAEAARQAGDVDDLVLIGSPGTGAETADELGVDPDHVWIGRNGDDPIRHVGTAEGVVHDIAEDLGIDTGDLGHGRDPLDDGFGGNLLDAPDGGGHSGYWDPASGVGASVALIIDGRPSEAAVTGQRGPGTPR